MHQALKHDLDRDGRAALRWLLAVVLAATLLASPAAARADAPVLATNGSSLQAAPNLALPGGANQCLARPYIGAKPGQIQFINTGQSYVHVVVDAVRPTGEIVANTYVPRGAGAVTKRPRAPRHAPAPLQFAVLSSGGGLCCTTRALAGLSAGAQQVNEFAMNLPAGRRRQHQPLHNSTTSSWSRSPVR